MNNTNHLNVLDFISDFQARAQSIKRFVGNPYVEGDNIAEHLSRLSRLLFCVAPALKKEFPDDHNLIERVMITILLHDDDEVIDGYDIPTAMKNHNSKDEEEILKFRNHISKLPRETQDYFLDAFTGFRKKESLESKIAKALDNIAGNQLVIEQKIGLINPDQARFAIEYVQKVKGISSSIDLLIESQINQIVETRKSLLANIGKVNFDLKISESKALSLLSIDIFKHELDRSKVNLPLTDL